MRANELNVQYFYMINVPDVDNPYSMIVAILGILLV